MMSNTSGICAIASHKGRAERRDNFGFLRQITVPTMVVAGELDYFFRATDVETVAQSIPNAKFILIRNSGHLPNMEQPEAFNRYLQTFYYDFLT